MSYLSVILRGMDHPQEQRYARSQTYAAEPTDAQKAAFDVCRAGATWFYNEAVRSQLDRHRHRQPVDVIEIQTSFCAQLYGKRAAVNRAAKAVAAALGAEDGGQP